MKIFQDRFLIIFLLLGLLIRILLAPIQGFKFDVDTWFYWAERLNSVGLDKFYSTDIWTGYTPGFLYILGFLGFIKNLFQIDAAQFYSVLKFPSILAEMGLGILVYQIIPKNLFWWRRTGLIFVMLNPSFIFNSAIFGQFDGLFSFTVLLAVYFLTQKKPLYASILGGISFLLKPQAILLVPIFLIYLIKNFSIKNIFFIILPAVLIIFF